MKNREIIIGVIVLLIILILIITTSTTGFFNLKEDKYIEVAYISALSGDAGVWGQSLKKGFDFAVKEINSQGGIDGKLIKPIYEDDLCDTKSGINAYKKVIELDNVKIITGTVCSSVALSVAPITQENNILYMASGATHPDVTKQGDLIFRIWVSDAYEAKEVAEFATQEMNFKKLAIIHMNDNPAGIALKEEFVKTTKKNNAEITAVEEFSSDVTDFRTIATKLIESHPEGIYVMATPEQLPLIINQLKVLKYTGMIFAYGPSILSEGIADKITDKSNIYYPNAITKELTNFWNDYKNKTGESADVLVAGGYDSMKLIEDGLKHCGEDNECIRDYWLSLKDYETSRGLISYDETGDLSEIEYEIKELNYLSFTPILYTTSKL